MFLNEVNKNRNT